MVFPLPEWRFGPVCDSVVVVGLSQTAAFLLEIPPAVPAVCVLAEALSRLHMNAFGISDRGPGTGISVSMLTWADVSYSHCVLPVSVVYLTVLFLQRHVPARWGLPSLHLRPLCFIPLFLAGLVQKHGGEVTCLLPSPVQATLVVI